MGACISLKIGFPNTPDEKNYLSCYKTFQIWPQEHNEILQSSR